MNEASNSDTISSVETTSIADQDQEGERRAPEVRGRRILQRAHQQEVPVVAVAPHETVVGLGEQRVARPQPHVTELARQARAVARNRDHRGW